MLKLLKQIFHLESIPCVCLHDILMKLLAKLCLDALFVCLSRFVAFRVTLNNFCCGLFSRLHLRVTNQSWQTGPNESAFPFRSCFCSWLTSNWEVSLGRSGYIFVDFAQIQLQFVISSYIEDNETILLIGKRFLCVLYDSLKRLSAKIFVESLFNGLFRVDAFGFTLTILVV